MADGTITVEVSTKAAREEIDRLREELACVRQALPEMWRDSELSVAVSTLAAENDLLKREAHTWSKAAEHYAKDAERWHAELQHDVLDDLRRTAQRCIVAWTVMRGGVWDPNGLMDEHMAALRKALWPNVRGNADPTAPRTPE